MDDAVKRLETQIHTHNFKLREEEKIVREINELKKSKRSIRDYDAKKVRVQPTLCTAKGTRFYLRIFITQSLCVINVRKYFSFHWKHFSTLEALLETLLFPLSLHIILI